MASRTVRSSWTEMRYAKRVAEGEGQGGHWKVSGSEGGVTAEAEAADSAEGRSRQTGRSTASMVRKERTDIVAAILDKVERKGCYLCLRTLESGGCSPRGGLRAKKRGDVWLAWCRLRLVICVKVCRCSR